MSSIKNVPKSEEMREHHANGGSETLSVLELLTMLISSGNEEGTTSQIALNLLKTFGGNLAELFSATVEELSHVEGMTFAKACKMKAVFELGKRIVQTSRKERPLLTSTDDVVILVLCDMMHLKQEELRVILLDSKNRLIRSQTVSVGSLDSFLVEPQDVFRTAVAHAAASIILVHNHLSGDPTPSEHDIILTGELCMCGRILGIEILDHVIIGSLDYVSMKHREVM